MNFRSIKYALPVILILAVICLQSCKQETKPKILYINSYHEGYPSSDDIMDGIKETLSGTNVILEFAYLNGTETPVVFCGVNWSAEKYALKSNVTGMLEVLPLTKKPSGSFTDMY